MSLGSSSPDFDAAAETSGEADPRAAEGELIRAALAGDHGAARESASPDVSAAASKSGLDDPSDIVLRCL